VRTVLGVFLIGIFILGVIGFAAAATWLVVKVSPSPKPPEDSKATSD
jgi:hypothetical protein